jgi:transcriptional regulator with XRE-family HTH domain
MDLELLQREAAVQLGVHADTYRAWEQGVRRPLVRHWPNIIRFLGYDPRTPEQDLGERLRSRREGGGWSQETAASFLGVSSATLWRWETGARTPKGTYLARVYRWLDDDPRPTPSTVRERLRRHREDRAITMRAMARKLRVALSTLCRWEAGEREPQGEYRTRVEKALAG